MQIQGLVGKESSSPCHCSLHVHQADRGSRGSNSEEPSANGSGFLYFTAKRKGLHNHLNNFGSTVMRGTFRNRLVGATIGHGTFLLSTTLDTFSSILWTRTLRQLWKHSVDRDVKTTLETFCGQGR